MVSKCDCPVLGTCFLLACDKIPEPQFLERFFEGFGCLPAGSVYPNCHSKLRVVMTTAELLATRTSLLLSFVSFLSLSQKAWD